MYRKIVILLLMTFCFINLSCNKCTKEYFPSGQLKVEYCENKFTGKGKAIYYYENGREEEIRNYTNGVENGEVRKFHENGKLRCLGYYKNGIEDSLWKYYYSDGHLETEIETKNSKIYGSVKKFYKNGTLKEYSLVYNNDSITFIEQFDEKGELIYLKRKISIESKDSLLANEELNISVKILGPIRKDRKIKLSCYFIVAPDNNTVKVSDFDIIKPDINFKVEKVPTNARAIYFFGKEICNNDTILFTEAKEIFFY